MEPPKLPKALAAPTWGRSHFRAPTLLSCVTTGRRTLSRHPHNGKSNPELQPSPKINLDANENVQNHLLMLDSCFCNRSDG